MPRAAWSAGRNQPDALGPVPEPPPTVQPPPVPTGRTWVIAGIGMILLVLGLAVAAGVIFAGASPGTAVAAGR